MKDDTWNISTLPIYGALTGVELTNQSFKILPGISLRQIYADTFGTTMMAFAPPSSENTHHPAPWVAVRGGFSFESRAEIVLEHTKDFPSLTPPEVIWLVAAVLRLRVQTPIRLAVIGNMSFTKMSGRWKNVRAIAFEPSTNQIGVLTSARAQIGESEIEWLHDMIPVAAKLYDDERFNRAFSVYEQAQWAATPEMGSTLVWTAIEILFDLSGVKDKTKAICRALSNHVTEDKLDRDRAYQYIKNLYYKRGRVVHAGRSMTAQEVMQSFQLARTAFQGVLIEGKLPVATT